MGDVWARALVLSTKGTNAATSNSNIEFFIASLLFELLIHRDSEVSRLLAGVELIFVRFPAGDGPVASSLRRPPTHLTKLAIRAGGHFDEAYVIRVIDGVQLVAEHGPREMPVWGAIFDRELQNDPYAGFTTLLRARTLTEYLRSIQTP